VVYEAISHVSKLSQKRSFNITVPDEVITVLIDGKLIVQVLINLLENAIKYTEDDGNICIRVYPEDNNIIFEVEDDGTGIDNSIKDLLFEGFVTQSSKVIDGRRSMGLGLSICKAIVEAHGGCIFAENIITGGALFKFSIPFEEDRQCMTAPEY
jgi:two-component system sensor histidine kinase KdpD